ncbi:hypothetical protein DER46DRAFT_249964 [Fusarium sp. MPI-SDFR-AT-0072]|nr:hypothetical protein DER46DRAFT_249964 [Fusarium sp. MPI-SDFR-AT-0072]
MTPLALDGNNSLGPLSLTMAQNKLGPEVGYVHNVSDIRYLRHLGIRSSVVFEC